jgi:hypothetical protein
MCCCCIAIRGADLAMQGSYESAADERKDTTMTIYSVSGHVGPSSRKYIRAGSGLWQLSASPAELAEV